MFNRLQPQPVNARRRGHVRQPEDRTSPGIACGRLFVLPLARRDGWPGAAVRLEDAHGGGCKFLLSFPKIPSDMDSHREEESSHELEPSRPAICPLSGAKRT